MSTINNGAREPTKVVFINTRYVETDPENFKAVVQRLTGKAAEVDIPSPAPENRGSAAAEPETTGGAPGRDDGFGASSGLRRNCSAEEFEEVLMAMELQPLDEVLMAMELPNRPWAV